MKIEWSKNWNASKRPNKQRKFRFNAPLHVQHSFLGAHLSPELRKKYTLRSLPLRKGDKVKILRGQYKKKTGKVTRILMKTQKVYIEGIETLKKDGSKAFVPLQPSNVMIIEMELTDKYRKGIVERKSPKEKK
ncbi:50S ribosomal protein L24 [Candidatus Woesearchaeota archaeon]|nr:50S ribosomal protein L24 [Candidatus Woesearchaeota archaeon]